MGFDLEDMMEAETMAILTMQVWEVYQMPGKGIDKVLQTHQVLIEMGTASR